MVDTWGGGLRNTTVGRLLPLGAIFLAVGLSSAIATPFVSLFLSTAVHAGPLRLTGYLTAVPLAAAAVSSVVARVSDRRPTRHPVLLLTAVGGAVNAALFAFVREYWVLLGLAVTAGAVGGALFPQAFAYARELMRRDDPDRAAVAISSMRTVFSIAWVAGPPLAAILLAAGGFRAVYGAAAAGYAVSALVALLLGNLAGGSAATSGERAATGAAVPPGVWPTLAGFALLQCVSQVGVQAMALYLTRDLHGSVRDSGLILGLCAMLEIPLMTVFGLLAGRLPLIRLILAGTGVGVGYYAFASAAAHGWQVAALQVPNAIFVASWTGLGIAYVQDTMPDRPGRATTMFTNTFPVGLVLAAPVLGAAQRLGFRYAYLAGSVLCLAGLGLLAIGRTRLGARPRAGSPDHAGAA